MAKETVSRYWEDLEIGEEYTTPSRTVTEADIVSLPVFPGITMSFTPVKSSVRIPPLEPGSPTGF